MKRKVPPAVAKGILSRVPFNVSFWLCTNESLRSLADVYEALERATDEVFRYHVNRDKNDFEVWIREVIKDKDLAREIARVKTKDTLVRKIRERVDELRAIIKRNDSKKKPARKAKARKTKKRAVARKAKRAKRAKKGARRKQKGRKKPRRRRGR